uniref:Uncharacterized protein n=1 Tax=Quercus lobata TaxID=97700 RepID=A0A7N2M815_QUELO
MWNPKAVHGWETTPHDYHADNVQRMERMLSIITDIPQYRNVHRALNYKVTCEEPFSAVTANQLISVSLFQYK